MSNSSIPLSKEIGERLRDARRSAKLTLGDLSERTEWRLSKSRISNYEQGIRRMGVEEARELAAALGTVTPAWLLCVENPMDLGLDEMDLINRYRATDARGRALLIGLVSMLSATGDGSVSAGSTAGGSAS